MVTDISRAFLPESHEDGFFAAIGIFVRVVESGSFTAAARQVNGSTAQISRAVAFLERQLGVRLLNRTTRHIGMTESGERYFKRAKTILADIEHASAEARNRLAKPYGKLRVHAMPSLGLRYLTSAMVQYQVSNPDVKIELTLSERFPNLIEDGIDVSLMATADLPTSSCLEGARRQLQRTRRVAGLRAEKRHAVDGHGPRGT
jgi:DNA-binding transcriptional LysR family regulator